MKQTGTQTTPRGALVATVPTASPDDPKACQLELRRVCVSYDGSAILRDVSFRLAQQSRTALMGSSGVGKTTLVRALSGLIRPMEGMVLFEGAVLPGPTKDISVVFQGAGCFPWLSAWENALFPLRNLGLHRDPAEVARVDGLLRKVGLAASKRLLPHQLSGGMLQRVSLVRAVAGRPRLIVLDEPFSALDPVTRADMRTILKDLQREEGFSFLLVTHDINDALDLADSILVLHGRPAAVATIPVADSDTPVDLLEKLGPLMRAGR